MGTFFSLFSNFVIVVVATTTAVMKSLVILSVIVAVTANYHHHHHDDHHHEHHGHYQPYGFGYDVHDGHGNTQYRHEKGHSPHEVKGSYGYKDAHGIHRHVDYVADKHGFRAHVKTNEPGTAPKDPAAVKMDAHPVPNPEPHGYHGHGGSYHHKHTEHHHGHHGHPNHYAASQRVVNTLLPKDYSFLIPSSRYTRV